MKHRVSTLIVGVAVCSGAPLALPDPPEPAPPEVEIVSATEDCGAATLEASPDHGFTLRLASFTAETSPTAPSAHRFCLVDLRVNAPVDAVVVRDRFEVSGSATIAPGARGSLVSIRYFAPGDIGSNFFKDFDPEAGTVELTGASEGKEQLITRGKETRLSLLLNLTARSAPRDPTQTSAITIKEIKVPTLLHPSVEPRCGPPRGS